jgi:enoyl-CoA hydratase
MNQQLAEETCAAITDCQDAGAIVLTGSDPAFCAGLDLRDLGVDQLGELAPFVHTAAVSEVPMVAAVNGAAVTGGFELALACDFIIASERAVFADTHLRVGVYPGPVAVDLPRRVGEAWAREILLTGNFVDAELAARIGIANRVVPHAELRSRTIEIASAIAEQDREMVRALRHDLDESVGTPLEAARRIHEEHAARGGYRSGSGVDLATHRDAVLERSRRQRT